jgi:hypothetical protein
MTDVENYYTHVPLKPAPFPIIHPSPGFLYSIGWARPSDFAWAAVSCFVAHVPASHARSQLLGGGAVPAAFAFGR